MKALVYKSTGSWYVVKGDDGSLYNARMKGKFKLDGITSTNPVTVGDEIDIAIEEGEEQSALITHIYDRRNYINRQSPAHKYLHHIIAANIDQTLLICTLREPRTSQGFIPAVLVFNKSDLHRDKEKLQFEERKAMYEAIGYTVILMSVEKNEGIKDIQQILQHKTSLISGHSGVGKSSFINAVMPSFALKTQEVSGWSGKGLHTTTFAEMFDLPFGGRIIDTPGIREFGLVDISKQELSHYFPEMRNVISDCQFNNCLHINEPGCAVKVAVEEGRINMERYLSYYNILDSIKDKEY